MFETFQFETRPSLIPTHERCQEKLWGKIMGKIMEKNDLHRARDDQASKGKAGKTLGSR
jgi:hypothetical protein